MGLMLRLFFTRGLEVEFINDLTNYFELGMSNYQLLGLE
jgi:hypothetical protein